MQIVKLNLIPGGVLPVCFASQNDTGRVIRFLLFEGENVFTLSGAETIALRLQKPDGSELVESVTNTGADYVDVVTTADTCDTAGASVGEIVITDGGDVLGSANFGLFVESDAFDSSSDIVIQTASGAIATFETNIETAFVSLKSDINPVQDLHGYTKPWSGGAGKNLLNYDSWKTVTIARGTGVWENNGLKITATVDDAYTDYGNNYFPVDARIPVSEGETITLSWEETTNKSGLVVIFPNGTTTGMVSVNNGVSKKLSYTATSGVEYVSFRFGVANSGDTIAYKNIQIEKGSQATSFEPYSNICPISGFSALNVTRTGKNLFNPSDVVEGYTSNTSGAINGVNTHNHSSGLIKVIGGEKYIITTSQVGGQWGAWYDASNNFISGFSGYDNPITAPNNAGYCRFTIEYNDNNPSYASNVMFEKGQTRSTYAPYNGQTATVNFGQTVYGGVSDVTNGKVTVTHVKKIIGANDISDNGTSGGLIELYVNGTSNKKNGQTNMLCNNLEVRANASAYAIRGRAGSSSVTFCLPTSDVPDFNSAKTWVTNNPIELVYELATPIEITTTPENLTAISGENNVYSDTNGDTEVEYYIEV